MSSKDVRPQQRLGQTHIRRKRIISWILGLIVCGGGVLAAYRYTGTTEVEVAVARVRRGDFIISVRTRGDIRSSRSVILSAPQVPDPRIVKLTESGRFVKKGDVIIELDAVSQEQTYIQRATDVRTADSEIVQMKATQKIENEQDAMSLMSNEYDLERSKLDASKAEILSEIDGAKFRIDVTVADGVLQRTKTVIKSRAISQGADLERINQKKDKTVRDMELARSYMSMMVVRAPIDGIVNVLPNFRSSGSFGQSPPPFKEGDRAWTGAAIAEIPDLSNMYVDLKLEEVDRGKLKLGQAVRLRVDAIPEQEFQAELDWISPIAALIYKGGGSSEKTFPARATLKNLDSRLRPGMSASSEIIIERDPNALLIPARANFTLDGKPAVYVQQGKQFLTRTIAVGKRNDEDFVVTGGLKEGEMVTLENPAEAATRAKKKV